MQFTELLLLSGNFIALDISVRSTGWVRYVNKVLTYGTYKIQAQTDRERRKEFGNFLFQLIGQEKYEFIAVEDVIFGTNFETTKALMQLNVVVEDLMDNGQIAETSVIRIGNTVWKKRLYQIANTTQHYVLRTTDDKKCIRDALHALGFNFVQDTIAQDIYDALGIGLVCIADRHSEISNNVEINVKKLHTDLHKGYKLEQCDTVDELQSKASKKIKRTKRFKNIVQVKDSAQYSNLAKHFKDIVTQMGDDNIFVIDYDLNKVGSVLLTKSFVFTINQERVYFLAYLR